LPVKEGQSRTTERITSCKGLETAGRGKIFIIFFEEDIDATLDKTEKK
jgi:hypothetical protein